MRIAVLGAAGQLGRDLCPRLPGEVVPLTRAEIDLAAVASIPRTLDAVRPDVLINCAAYNWVDRAEAEPGVAFAVNALGVRQLAAQCAARGIRFVHFSTDYVFGLDETRTTPLTEGNLPGPVSVYGLSKLAGEYFARTECPEVLVIRTCGLYGVWGSGGKGGNFVETMLRLAATGQPIRVVNDQRCTPSYTVDVAEATMALIHNAAQGIFHVTNAGSCTWYEFAAEIFRQAGLKPNLQPITSAEYGAAARRPRYSVLSNAKLAGYGQPALRPVPPPRPWPDALAAYLAERTKRTT
jgi:dTDP-4-dehydrorhamnose reductase